ncbi:nitroreductase family protein [Candidatus Entotheonella palauensis]|uniref:Putative NAD(P)H nitroreductase n=1 Tax=Candidatus Entotheonella gemina TaxID=1429439 RepID=W4MDC9_9BACT|nr:nitroreductase [Candidatus Entotheonella palauensis]ETX07931.1 MAG: hypothetical protein ETSY2_08315 [Candidatus Entotheonella gemina]
MNPDLVLQVIRHRRTIKPDQFSREKVPRGVINDILASANWAPTYENTEPWRFVVFEGHAKCELARIRAALQEKRNESDADADAATMLQIRLEEAGQCSHIIALGMKRHVEVPEITEIMGTGCAIQNMLLTAASHGVGVKWSFGGRRYSDELRSFLGLAPNDGLFGFLLIGYPRNEWPEGKRHAPISDKVQWHGDE